MLNATSPLAEGAAVLSTAIDELAALADAYIEAEDGARDLLHSIPDGNPVPDDL